MSKGGLEKWVKMNMEFKKERDNLIIKDMADRYKKYTKNKSAPGGFMEKGERKFVKGKKAKSKALDWFKKGQGGKGDLPPGRKDSDNE